MKSSAELLRRWELLVNKQTCLKKRYFSVGLLKERRFGAEFMNRFNSQSYQHLLEQSRSITKENLFWFFCKIQDTFGYIPQKAIFDLAERTSMPVAHIYGAITAYPQFKIRKD